MPVSQQHEYNALLEMAKQIPPNRIKKMHMPISTFLFEVKQLLLWSTTDKAQLLECGLPGEIFDELEFLSHKATDAHIKVNTLQMMATEEDVTWKEKKAGAKRLRYELIRCFSFAFRNDDKLITLLRSYAKHSTNLLLTQDLYDLVEIGESNRALLETTNFNMNLLEQARTEKESLREALAHKSSIIHSSKPIRTNRDQLLSMIKSRVDKIRQAGKFIFANNPERLKGYVSQYIKRKNNKKRAKMKK